MIKTFIQFNRELSSKLFKNKKSCTAIFQKIIQSEVLCARNILEIGGSNRPHLEKSVRYNYWGLDIDELKDYSGCYNDIYIGNISNFDQQDFDLILSNFLMEHVKDVEEMYLHQIRILKSKGKIIHVYPLGWHPFSICTRIAQNMGLTRTLIKLLRPETSEINGYYTYYNCGSPGALRKCLSSFDNIDFRLTYTFEAEDYFSFFFPFGLSIYILNKINQFFGLNFFASNVIVEITKK
jgi:hypothetical protein